MKCKACGLEHSPLMRCEVYRRIVEATQVADSASVEDGIPSNPISPLTTPAPKFDKRAYQREYMRAYRKKK
jgi:hypothetical protein